MTPVEFGGLQTSTHRGAEGLQVYRSAEKTTKAPVVFRIAIIKYAGLLVVCSVLEALQK